MIFPEMEQKSGFDWFIILAVIVVAIPADRGALRVYGTAARGIQVLARAVYQEVPSTPALLELNAAVGHLPQ